MAVKVEGEYKEVFRNLDHNLIAITDDKLFNIIDRHLRIALKQNDWVGLVGILVTIIIALVTCKFDDILGITNSGVFLLAIFVISAALILICLIKTIVQRQTTDTEKMMAEIKKNNAREG